MNGYQQELWDNLAYLVQTNEAFYCQDYTKDGMDYRIFNYRLASYSDFLLPGALECRGTMFRITKHGPQLVSLPPEKFFNLNENPMTMDLDLSTIISVEDKADGSLISTYLHFDAVRLKSKGSIASDQAMDANEWLSRAENMFFKRSLLSLVRNHFTINMEWTAPFNRVVISYQKPRLTILNVRHNKTGQYVPLDTLASFGPEVTANLVDHWITTFTGDHIADVYGSRERFVEMVPDMADTEGYIYKMASGQSVKHKTHWYLVQHRAKDSINSDRRLFETVVADAHDDLRSMFHDDEWVLKRIQWMEDLVGKEYNHMVATVEAFYDINLGLDRKDYAIKAKDEVKPLWFGLCMNLYLGKPVDYKGFMMSKWKHYGIKDQQKGEV